MENLTYDQALTELQQIVQALENGNISMDELPEKIDRAAVLIEFCKEKLRQNETQVNNLLNES